MQHGDPRGCSERVFYSLAGARFGCFFQSLRGCTGSRLAASPGRDHASALGPFLNHSVGGSAIIGSIGAFTGICLSCAMNMVSGGVFIALVSGFSFLLVHQFAPSHRTHSVRGADRQFPEAVFHCRQSTLLRGDCLQSSVVTHGQPPRHRSEWLLLSRPSAGKRDRNSAEVFLDAALSLQTEIHATVRGHGEWSQARRENFQAMLVPVSAKAKVCCVSVFGKTGNSAPGKLAPFQRRPGAHTPQAR
jgi:hypothetical protein